MEKNLVESTKAMPNLLFPYTLLTLWEIKECTTRKNFRKTTVINHRAWSRRQTSAVPSDNMHRGRSKTVYSPLFSCIYYTKTGGNLDFKCIVGMGIGLAEKEATPSLTLFVIKRIKHSEHFSTVSHTGHVRRSCVTIWLQYMADSLRWIFRAVLPSQF